MPIDEAFIKKYKPLLFTKKLFDRLSDRMKEIANDEDKEIKFIMWCKYGTEFLTAYIIWVLNGSASDDFSTFTVESSWLKKIDLDEIITTFIELVSKESSGEDIDTNFTKKDSEYKKIRAFLDANGIKLSDLIRERFLL